MELTLPTYSAMHQKYEDIVEPPTHYSNGVLPPRKGEQTLFSTCPEQ